MSIKKTHFWLLIAAIVLVRVWAMCWLPLTDNTEARYGEIARLTAQNGFWLMPHVDINTPFFAKPPLSTWLNAISIYILGASEWAARLPALILSAGTLYVAWLFAKDLKLQQPWFVIAATCICPIFFICAGAVMTDATQLWVISTALWAAWRIFSSPTNSEQQNLWRWIFWLSIGLAALTKGLATWALIGLPLLMFGVIERQPWWLFKQLLNAPAMIVAGLLFVPWYWAANIAYPGFLNYFIIGEHFSRFLVAGWTGDRYGTAHSVPLGTIWLFWGFGILPWLGVFGVLLWRQIKQKTLDEHQRLRCFLWCAVLAPLCFFSLARNIIATYALTSVVPFTLLLGLWFEQKTNSTQKRIVWTMAIFPVLMVLAMPYIKTQLDLKSDKNIVLTYQQQGDTANQPLVYGVPSVHSSRFYAQENLVYAKDWMSLNPHYVVLDTDDWLKKRIALPEQTVELARNKVHVLLRLPATQ